VSAAIGTTVHALAPDPKYPSGCDAAVGIELLSPLTLRTALRVKLNPLVLRLTSPRATAGLRYSVDHAVPKGGGKVMTGTCVSCGMTDVEVNEQGECADCAGEAAAEEEEE